MACRWRSRSSGTPSSSTDAGSWMMHCHILEHAEAGMMTMIDVEKE
ncbi:multicopper oxidase domain-containing protein [Archangium sp. Cb G35]